MSTGNSTLAQAVYVRTVPNKNLGSVNGHSYTADSTGKVQHSNASNTSAFDNGIPTDYIALLAAGCDHLYSGPASPLARA